MSISDPQDFGVLLNLAFAAFKDALNAELAAAGFDDIGSSFGYVFRLLSDAPCSLSELAVQLRMTSPGALKVVDDMVAKGYVSRNADEGDRRVKRLELTNRGRAALNRARLFHKTYEESLAQQVGPSQLAATRKLLEVMTATASEQGGRLPRPA